MIEKQISEASEKARKKIDSLRENHDRELKALQEEAEKNLDRAVEMVLDSLREI